jgi:hypothetical protein
MFMRSGLEALIKSQFPETSSGGNIDQLALEGEVERAWNKVRAEGRETMSSANWFHKVYVERLDGSRRQRVMLAG